jgi:hypothetical protein
MGSGSGVGVAAVFLGAPRPLAAPGLGVGGAHG